MNTNLLLNQPTSPLNSQQTPETSQMTFNGVNPLLKNKQKVDEFELEKHLDTKEGQIAFLEYHLAKAKGSQGFIARGFNKLKGLTGLGLSSKKLDAEIKAFIEGQIPFEKVCQDINKFKYNQKEATEILIDSITMGTSFAAECYGNKYSTLISPVNKIGGMLIKGICGLPAGCSMIVKPLIKLIDSLGMEKSERKANRTIMKDILTGYVNGVGGSILANQAGKGYGKFIATGIGVATTTSGVRYLTIPKEEKSFEDFCHQQIENPVLKLGSLAAIGAFGLWQCNNATKMQKAVKELTPHAKLTEVEVSSSKAPIRRIVDNTQLFTKSNVMDILRDNAIPQGSINTIEKTMQALEDYNIFIPKFLQTLSDNEDTLKKELANIFGLSQEEITKYNLVEIVQRFKTDCTGARTQEKAQQLINEIFGDNKYTIIPKEDYMDKDNVKPLGVGSVAETWKVQDSSGKKYAIKLLKNGVTKDKIAQDKAKMLAFINQNETEDKEFCIKSLEELYKVWEQELDLEAEMKNGEMLAKNLTHARVAKGIEVKKAKDGTAAYVMELAQGTQLSEYLELESIRQQMGCSKQGEFGMLFSPVITKLEYMQVVFEQLLSVPKNGEKVMHADPHPGNIFIDYDPKTDKPIFTFIDTGNVIKVSNDEALHNTINHLNYFLGNTDAIARTHLNNANLNGKDKEKCVKDLSKHLYDSFYNGNKLSSDGKMDIFAHIDALINNWMQENGITPDPKLANSHKAEATYFTNSKAFDVIAKMQNDISAVLQSRTTKTIEQHQQDIKRHMKDFDKIEYLLKEPSSDECKKYDLILDKYINTINEIHSLCDEVSHLEESVKNAVQAFCNEQLYLLEQKVEKIMEQLNEYIDDNFKNNDDRSRRYTSYKAICNAMYQKIKNDNKNTDGKNRKKYYDDVKLEHNLETYFQTYEELDKQYKAKKDKNAQKKMLEDAGTGLMDTTKAGSETVIETVKTILKDMLQHFPSSCKELIQLDKFIDEHPDKAMQGLIATLG